MTDKIFSAIAGTWAVALLLALVFAMGPTLETLRSLKVEAATSTPAFPTITDPVAIEEMIRVVNDRGYYCTRSFHNLVIGIDGSYGPTVILLCDTATYKISLPTRGRYVVRVEK